jgi:hypothetical protein
LKEELESTQKIREMFLFDGKKNNKIDIWNRDINMTPSNL